ncbi:hypothetical protein [Olleya sp. YS]|uniref:hypothetical protein n=1 Tax=Olleya sp. YS TaxID=3028318 RepID=UPI0024345757|nr:hypothetical protein [Olleya sp. YS]WGD35329.1 hypothetical protein Ollyesu_02720 [Olleya sp. YS]
MNIKKTLYNFANWIFTGLTFIGFILIYIGIGARGRFRGGGEPNIYFVLIGIVLILPLIIYLIKSKIMIRKAIDKNTNRVNTLIKNGDKLIIDLDTLVIKSNSYKQDIEVGRGYNTRNEYIDINHNVIVLEIPYKNILIKYKLNINMDTTKLKMHFAIKERTELYIDPNNPTNNYLDLRFLEN